jgi:hypothetical protein
MEQNRDMNQEVSIGRLQGDLEWIKNELSDIKCKLDSKYVTMESFAPVKNVVYGLVGIILMAVIGGLITLVVR